MAMQGLRGSVGLSPPMRLTFSERSWCRPRWVWGCCCSAGSCSAPSSSSVWAGRGKPRGWGSRWLGPARTEQWGQQQILGGVEGGTGAPRRSQLQGGHRWWVFGSVGSAQPGPSARGFPYSGAGHPLPRSWGVFGHAQWGHPMAWDGAGQRPQLLGILASCFGHIWREVLGTAAGGTKAPCTRSPETGEGVSGQEPNCSP